MPGFQWLRRALAAALPVVASLGCDSAEGPGNQRAIQTALPASWPSSPLLPTSSVSADLAGRLTEMSIGDVRFTMRLPSEWSWSNETSRAVKEVRPGSSFIQIISGDLPADGQSAEASALQRLDEILIEDLPDQVSESSTTTVWEQRAIKVGELNAVWKVIVTHDEKQSPPVMLRTMCYLRCAGKEFTIEGFYNNFSEGRTSGDFYKSQSELLQISQSFQVEDASLVRRLGG